MTVRGLLAVVLLGALVVGAVLAWPRLEGTPPDVVAPEAVVVGGEGRTVQLEVSDPASGVRHLEVRLQHAGGTRPLEERAFPGHPLRGGVPGSRSAVVEVALDPRALGLADGAATLLVSARDWSWRGGFAGNRAELSVPVTIDTRPPRVELESGLTYAYRGGSAAAVYRVSEPPERDGVRVGDAFFAGHPAPGADPLARVALFAVPVGAEADPDVTVVAEDAAGNASGVSFPARIFERRFASTRVSLPDGFLEDVAVPLAEEAGFPTDDPAAAFHRVNTELRARNEARIREIVGASQGQARWEGAFEQWPGSAVTSRFAEQRRYEVGGRVVSRARHFGFDLAATARAPVTASNHGVVLFADRLGIYGNCVILDHGLGLTSLYAHLSSISVQEGDAVEKGQRLGRSGDTGLAGGDHLHFALLVGGRYVDPLEWWDPRWVESHVTVRLEAAGREG